MTLGLLLAIVAGVAMLPFVSMDGRIPRLQNLAAAQFGQPVKIQSLHLSLLPRPHWRIGGLVIGSDGQFKAQRVTAYVDPGALFAARPVFKAIELDAPVLNDEALGWLLFGRPQRHFGIGQLSATGARLDSANIALPAFDVSADIGTDGRWRSIAAHSTDRTLGTELRAELRADGDRAQLRLHADTLAVPFGSTLVLKGFSATGSAQHDGMALTEFAGRGYGGTFSGNARLNWGAPWRLDGAIAVTGLAAEQLLPSLLEAGKLDGKARYAMQADSADKLFAMPDMAGTFALQNGVLTGVDLVRLLQREGVGGKTPFATLGGELVRDAGRTQLRQLSLGAGSVSAQGNADMDAAQRLRGRFTAKLTVNRLRARANFSVAGTLALPRFKR